MTTNTRPLTARMTATLVTMYAAGGGVAWLTDANIVTGLVRRGMITDDWQNTALGLPRFNLTDAGIAAARNA